MNDPASLYQDRDYYLIAFLLGIIFLIAPLFPQLTNPAFAFYFHSVIYLLLVVVIYRSGWINFLSRLWQSPLLIPVLLALLWMYIGLFYTPDPYHAKEKFSVYLTAFLFYCVLFLVPFTTRFRYWLCFCLALGGFFAAVHGLILQWMGFEDFIHTLQNTPLYDEKMNQELIASLQANRALGRFGNPNQLAGYLVMSLWPLWYILKQTKEKWLRGLMLLMALIMVICIYRTFSRSGLLALVLTIFLWGLFELHEQGYTKQIKQLLWIFVGLIVFGIITLMLAAWLFSDIVPVSVFGGRFLTISTIQARLHFFRGALLIISQHPWFGVGPEGYEGFYCALIRPGDAESRYVHNFFLEAGVEGGIIAVLLLLWVLFIFIKYVWRQFHIQPEKQTLIYAAFGAALVFLLLSAVDFHNNLMEFWIIPVLLFGQIAPYHIQKRYTSLWVQRAGIFVGILFIMAWILLPASRYFNEISRSNGYYLTLDGQIEAARAAYERAVLFDRTDAESWQGISYTWAGFPQKYAQLNRLNAIKQAVRWSPRRAAFHSDYAEALFVLGYFERALEEIQTAQQLFPARPKYYEIAARFYRQLGQEEKAKQEQLKSEQLKEMIEERKL